MSFFTSETCMNEWIIKVVAFPLQRNPKKQEFTCWLNLKTKITPCHFKTWQRPQYLKHLWRNWSVLIRTTDDFVYSYITHREMIAIISCIKGLLIRSD
jgi:hypothetical protein